MPTLMLGETQVPSNRYERVFLILLVSTHGPMRSPLSSHTSSEYAAVGVTRCHVTSTLCAETDSVSVSVSGAGSGGRGWGWGLDSSTPEASASDVTGT